MDNKLGLGALISLVLGSMIGAGIFSLPQNMANGAGVGAMAIGWTITGIGMIALAMVFQSLSMRRPDLDGGIFTYAQTGFGSFVGFNAAWGYWLCQLLANVSYAIVFFSALGYFFDSPEQVIFGDGNTLLAIIGASLLNWGITALVLRGVQVAAMVNIVTTIAKMLPLLVLCVALVLAFHLETFTLDVWGTENPALGSVLEQVKSTMTVTLWVFIGIEGAVVVSARARRRQDIGRATVIALLCALSIYVMVSLFALGVMTQPEVAALKNPSAALVMEKMVGTWGAWLINGALVVSVLGALLSWTVLAAEVAYMAASVELFPRWFARVNQHGSPTIALWVSAIFVQLFLIVIHFQESTYLALVNIATTAVLVPYVFSSGFALKLALTGETYLKKAQARTQSAETELDLSRGRQRDLLLSAIATGYGLWMVYAAGLEYLLLMALLYSPGIWVYRRVQLDHQIRNMNLAEQIMALIILSAAAFALYQILSNSIQLI